MYNRYMQIHCTVVVSLDTRGVFKRLFWRQRHLLTSPFTCVPKHPLRAADSIGLPLLFHARQPTTALVRRASGSPQNRTQYLAAEKGAPLPPPPPLWYDDFGRRMPVLLWTVNLDCAVVAFFPKLTSQPALSQVAIPQSILGGRRGGGYTRRYDMDGLLAGLLLWMMRMILLQVCRSRPAERAAIWYEGTAD